MLQNAYLEKSYLFMKIKLIENNRYLLSAYVEDIILNIFHALI